MLSLFCVLVCVVVAQPTMAIATASTKINGDLKGFIEPNFGRYASIAILDLSLMGPRLIGNKTKGAAVHALLLVRVGRINLPRSHLDSWVRPRLQFVDVLDRIGAFPVSERTRKELLVGALSPRWAGVHQLLISRSRILLVLYQSEVLSLPHRSKRIGLPLLHIDGRVPRMRVLTIWRNHRGDDVLAGRQIAIVILTFAQVRHFGTIDRD